ncbi:MAG: haloacid dehalogenase [Candidatus Lokiarchaeota archaeon]
MNLEDNFSKVTTFLDSIDGSREEILKISRQITRKCSVAIKSIHRAEFDLSKEKIENIQEELKTLRNLVNKNPGYFFKYLKIPEQEFAEAICLYAFIKGKEIPNHKDLNIDALNYALGLADVIGELRRYILDNIRKAKTNNLDVFLDIMEDIHTQLFSLDYPSGLTKDLRHKTDIARTLLEKTRGDISLSVQMNKLKDNLEEILKDS